MVKVTLLKFAKVEDPSQGDVLDYRRDHAKGSEMRAIYTVVYCYCDTPLQLQFGQSKIDQFIRSMLWLK